MSSPANWAASSGVARGKDFVVELRKNKLGFGLFGVRFSQLEMKTMELKQLTVPCGYASRC